MALGGMEVGRVFTVAGFKVDEGSASTYEKRVDRLREKARLPIKQEVKVDADQAGRGLSNYEKRVRDVDTAHGDLVRGTGRVRGAMGSLMIGGAGVAAATIGFGLLAKGVSTAFNAYKESEKVGRQTNAVLKSTGEVAGVSAGHVNNLANALSKKTGVDDEVIQSGENLLLTFTNVRNEVGKGNDVFDRATKTVVDMSAALGQDTSSSAIQLGKALNDPVKGITALQRVGVSFTKQQRDQIKTLTESGHRLDAQKIILRELNKEFGGSAERTATSSAKLKVTFGNLEEAAGKLLSPALERVASRLNVFIGGMVDGTGKGGRFVTWARSAAGTVRTVLAGAIDVGRRAFDYLKGTIEDNRSRLTSIGKTVTGLARDIRRAGGQIVQAFRETFGSGSSTGRDIKTIVRNVLTIYDAMIKVEAAIVRRVLPGIITAFRGAMQLIRGVIRVIAGVLSGDFGKAWDGVKDIFKGGLKVVTGLIRAQTAPLRAAAAAVGNAIAHAFSTAWSGIVGTAAGFVNRIIDVINIIPGVHLGHVGGGGGSSSFENPAGNATTGSRGDGSTRAATFASGGKVTAPVAIMGEEAPQHPEWVIPTNPAYRPRAVGLWMAAAKELGIPGFALGGVLDFAKSLPGRALKSAKGLAGWVGDKLPHAPGGILSGMGSYALGRARDYIGMKVGGVFKSVTNALHPPSSGGGGGGSTTGLVPQVLRALSFARGHGWSGSVASGLRSRASQQVLWDGAPGNGLIRGVSVAAPGTSEHERGRAVDVSLWEAFRSAMGIAPAASRLLWRGMTDPVHFSVSGHRRGGLVGGLGSIGGELLASGVLAFGKGGKHVKHKAPKPVLTSKANRGIKRSVARGQRGIGGFEDDIRRMETAYDQQDRVFGLSDEVFLIENDDGSVTVDQGMVNQRLTEIDKLIDLRTAIRTKINAYRRAIGRLMNDLRHAIAKLQRALGKAKGKARQKERGGYRQAIADYQSRLSDLKGTHTDLGSDVEDQRIDLLELGGERAEVAGTAGTPAPPAEAPDASPDAGAGGQDASIDTTDPTPAPPSASDIAAAAAEQLAAFSASRMDLFSSFGSNAETARGLAALLGGDEGRQAAGLRAFGAFGGETLGGVAGGGITINQHFGGSEPDQHVAAQTARFEIEGAIG